jgi:hypothetical protein
MKNILVSFVMVTLLTYQVSAGIQVNIDLDENKFKDIASFNSVSSLTGMGTATSAVKEIPGNVDVTYNNGIFSFELSNIKIQSKVKNNQLTQALSAANESPLKLTMLFKATERVGPQPNAAAALLFSQSFTVLNTTVKALTAEPKETSTFTFPRIHFPIGLQNEPHFFNRGIIIEGVRGPINIEISFTLEAHAQAQVNLECDLNGAIREKIPNPDGELDFYNSTDERNDRKPKYTIFYTNNLEDVVRFKKVN